MLTYDVYMVGDGSYMGERIVLSYLFLLSSMLSSYMYTYTWGRGGSYYIKTMQETPSTGTPYGHPQGEGVFPAYTRYKF